MAEFKLGRIRFVWKGAWTPGVAYLNDDVVSNGGKSYICVVNHTASSLFDTDLDALPTKWNIVSDGTKWSGDWTPSTYYNPGAVVKYGALIYICKTGHTSATYTSPTYLGLENNLNKWELFATSFNWEGNWGTSTRYRKNDFVVYGGTTYVCNFGHVSAATAASGLESNSNYWDYFNQGVTYLGEWSGSTVRYRVNDVVKHGGDLWICTTYHTSTGTTIDVAKFAVFVNGFQFENSWNNSTQYQIGDNVTYGGYSYIAKTNNINKQPTANLSDWAVFTTGFSFVGEWDIATNYKIGEVVRNGAYTYLALVNSFGQLPQSATAYWTRLNNGFRWTNSPQTYLAVVTNIVTGTGTGAKFDVIRSGTVYTVNLAAGFSGNNYGVGDKIKILGNLVGGITPANDITITVNSLTGSAINTFSWSGGSVTWSALTEYLVGDTVTFGANTYVCINPHTAAIGNRPDADITGAYWNLMTAGSEYNILTTTGDLVYYGANGPTRLPAGTNGQVLRSQSGLPVWANYGLINNLVYVGPLGSDLPYPTAGATIDQPWKTVRYAAKQVEDGYLNPNSKTLLAMNKQFMIKEITNWITYTYTVTVTAAESTQDVFTCASTANLSANMPISFTGTIGGVTADQKYYIKTITSSTQFTISDQLGGTLKQINDGTGTMSLSLYYDSSYCERDVGLIVEAVKYDISRGGTSKTVYAAKQYYTPAGNAYINSNFGQQTVQTIAAYTYLKTLLQNVAGNQAFTSYQVINNVAIPVLQQVDSTLSLTNETGVSTKIDQLITIITTGILAGTTTAIPAPVYPNTTISVKTGTFTEVLPIVIEEFTAVVGDELRSTVIQPAPANGLLVNDKPKSVAALTRINSLISDLVQNNTVTPTSGNSEVQKYVGGFAGSATVTTAVGTKTTIMTNILTNGLGSVPAYSLTDPTGYDAGYLNARRLIVSNKTFLQTEIAAFMNVNYTSLWNGLSTSDKNKVSRDVGYIVDALQYDLTYNCNLETIITARAYYFNGTFVGPIGQKTPTLAVLNRLKTIITYIAQGDNASWTRSTGNTSNQDDSLPHGSQTAGAFAQTRIQEIYDTINTTAEPSVVEPSTTWVTASLVSAKNAIQSKKAGISQGVADYITVKYPSLTFDQVSCIKNAGYIVDAISYDVMFTSNFQSVKSAVDYYVGNPNGQYIIPGQLTPSLDIITYIDRAVKQITNGYTGSIGSTTAVSRVEANTSIIYDIVASGMGAVPSYVIPTPTAGTGNAYDINYLNARTQIIQNYAFIKAEIAAYLNTNYNATWVALGATGQAMYMENIGYILDGVRYDITYGGNLQSLIVGSAYYSNYTLTIKSTDITATTAAYTRLKTIIGQIAQRQTVTITPGNAVSQVLTGTGDTVGTAAAFAQSRVQDTIDWINNGYAPTTITPSITWASSELQTSFAAVQAKKAEIQYDTVVWVKKYFQDINFNTTTCSRDVGYIVDALSYDLVFGSNFASITAGRAYQRATSSVAVVQGNQKNAELGSINFIKYKVKTIAAAGAVAQINSIISDITSYINGGAIPRTQWPNPSTVDSNYAAGVVLLTDNINFITAEVAAYIDVQIAANAAGFIGLLRSNIIQNFDVKSIIEALHYDLIYGYGMSGVGKLGTLIAGRAYYSALTGLLQIDSNYKTATIAAYNRLKSVAQSIIQDSTVTPSAGNTASQVRAAVGQTIGSAGSATSLGTLVDTITTIINNGLTTGVPRITATTVASGSTFTTNSAHGLSVGDEIIPQTTPTSGQGGYGLVAGTKYYVQSTPLTTTFTLSVYQNGGAITSFTNGTGLSLVLEVTNKPTTSWVSANLITQFNSLQANKATIQTQIINYITKYYPTVTYNQTTCQRDIGIIVDFVGYDMMFDSNYLSITSAKSYYRAQSSLVIGAQKDATIGAFRYLKTLMSTIVTTDSTAYKRVRKSLDIIINTMIKGTGSTPEVNGTITYKNDTGLYKAGEILRINKDFLAAETAAYTTLSYGGTVTTTTASTDRFTTSSAHNLTVGDPVVFSGTVITGSGVSANTIYYIATTPTTTTFTITAIQNSILPVNITSDGSGSMTVRYAFNSDLKRDTKEYIEAIIYDLSYTGNYKSLRAAEVYLNAVTGSQLSNMFYVSNGTGLRNCTLNGLNGSLTEENDYGTKRPTAGAFVALNPGFGPNDSHVWVNNRSHYSQNVSMFGTGCSGAKIDAAVHAGGNKSMTKNDFTTIISDGFGVWCTGQGSLTELVSVFNYYGYAGYMAELGGRIRATNGNSSYGSYGVIAEGTDTYEQPIYANINNHAAEAFITNVVTDSTNNILRVEFNNAGTNYTNADIAISGDGYNATTIAEEFRDSAVFETRLINLNDGNGVGGTNYGGAQNAAQSGNTYSITIANSDVALSTAYPGMRIQLTAGTGVGQYANILTFNQGTKIAQVYKDSFDALTITATGITNSLCTVAAGTSTLFPGMQVYLAAGAAAYNGLAANTLYYIRTANFSTTQFSLSESSASGSAVAINANGAVSITLYAAGWDHAVPGFNIANTLDLTTSYVIEPKINYTKPGYTYASRTAQSNAWKVSTYANQRFVALPSSGTATSYSLDGKTWSAGGTVPSASWVDVIYGGGQGATAIATVGGLGGQGAVLQAIMGKGQFVGDPTSDQVIGVKIIDGGRNYSTSPSIVFTPTAGGVGAKALCTVLNGAIDAVYIDPVNIEGTSYGSGYTAAPTVSAATDRITKITVSTYGRGYTAGLTNVVITGGGYSSIATATASINATSGVNAVTITDVGAGYTSTPTVAIVDSNARYVAIANGSTTSAFLLSDASASANWTTGGSTGQSTMNALAYGGGIWVAIGGTGSGTASSTNNAVSAWTTRSLPTLGSGSWNAITYGNGRFVATSTGSTLTTAYSTNGTSWTQGGNLPAGFTTGTSVAYGNGRFVAIASGARQVTYSIDNGVTWKTYGNGLPSSQTWTRIKYGQGIFVAIAQAAAVCAVSSDGLNWTEQALPATTNWSALAFGNPSTNPIWTILSATSGTTAASIRTGARALGRMKQSSGVISEIRMIEPGSGYPKGSVTATTITTNVISTSDTTNLIDSQPIIFSGCSAGGLTTEKLYYVIGSTIVANTSFKVSLVAGSSTAVVLSTATLTGTYRAGPIVTQTDPNKVKTAAVNPRTNDGVLGNPSFSNRGSTYTSATADTQGDGWADLYQPSTFVSVRNLHAIPQPGSNVAFSSIANTWYKLVAVTQILGNPGEYTATFQISPGLTVLNAPIDADPITNTIKYSQVRLTGHDFLYIGTGNQATTNYPYVDPTTSDITKQTRATAGGRVFFTSTDQDGNFNVGGLFGVQQSTGTATLNADAFNLSGLQSLQLGALNIGVGSAIITQFSTDPYFTADSDSIVPTQRAIKAYITAQIGGGQSSLNVNTLTAGIVYIANDSISTTSGAQLNIKAKMNFTGGIDGAPVALGFFLQR
jgi:hypothetical protein